MFGSKRNGRKRVAKSGSKERQSSSSEDSDLDMGETTEEEEKESKTRCRVRDARQWQVPNIDLWIPTRKDLSAPRTKELASVTLLSKGFSSAVVDKEEHRGAGGLVSLEPRTFPLAPDGRKEKLGEGDRMNSGSTKDSWRVSLAYVKSVLRRNCYELQRRNREISRKKRFASNSHGRVLPARENYKGQKGGLWNTTLYRRLMMAVTPWAGPVVQAWALRVKAEASHKSKVEFISKQLQGARLTSTPLFTLFIQLFHIDVSGCMKVIHKRKSRQLDLLKTVVGEAEPVRPLNPGLVASPVQEAPAPSSSQSSSLPPSKKLIPLKAKQGPNVPACPWKNFLPPYPPPKPKTVSELLREKRQREAKARRLEHRKVVLLPPSVIIQQSPVSLCKAGSSSQAAGQVRAPAGPLLPPVATPESPLPSAGSHGPSLTENSGGSEGKGLVKESEEADSRGCKRRKSRFPKKIQDAPGMASDTPSELPPPVTAAKPSLTVASPNSALGVLGTTRETPPSAPAFCTLGPLGPQQKPVTLVPTLVASQPAVPKQVLPITWVLTPQGLVPLALVNIPRQGEPPIAPGTSLDQSPVEEAVPGKTPTSSGPGVPPPEAQTPLTSSSSPQCKGVSPPSDLRNTPAASAQPPPVGSAELQSRPPSCPSAPQIPVLGSSQPLDPIKESSAPLAQPTAGLKEPLTPDYSLITLEEGSAVKDWAKGVLTISSPAGDTSLPYLPPFLCSLRTLSALLMNKESLEQSASSLNMPGVPWGESGRPCSDALRAAVHQRLKGNPAYQLLRARFLAALTFPAALASLRPSRVITTLSGNNRKDNMSMSEEEETSTETISTGRRQEAPNTDSADSDHLSEGRVQQSTHSRKRKRRQQL